MPTVRVSLASLTLVSFAIATASQAADHFLTIGGGYDPHGNQVSLERNVYFFRQLLAEQRTDNPPHDIYFADGRDPHRDLQFRDPDFECSPARHIAIELFGKLDDIDISYRNHNVEGVRDATSPRLIRNRLRELGDQLQDDDRLIIYATAHGGSGEDNTPFNTSIYTWNHRRFTASEFSDWLDELPEQTPVVMVMVQCYAGGFARTIFNEANPNQGLARQLRAGFFAQVHDRPAAGCTPDVNEESYQEYSSFFWAAIAGHDRAGNKIELVDFDGDGETSFAEAHAYAVCESETVDIPVRTSDAFLDYYSTDGTTGESAYDQARKKDEPRRLPPAEMVRAEGSLPNLLKHADAVDRAIVLGLAAKLGLDPDGDVSQVAAAVQRTARDAQRLRRDAGRATSQYNRARDRVKNEVRREWPELANEVTPTLAALMAERSDEFESKVTRMPGYKNMEQLGKDRDTKNDLSLQARKTEALALRLQHTIKRIVLTANLSHIASPKVVDRYQELLTLESGTLQHSKAAPPEPRT
jgi:hypothetical protein